MNKGSSKMANKNHPNKTKFVDRKSGDADSNWPKYIAQFSDGANVDPSMFRGQHFLDWSVLKASLLRDQGLKVMMKDEPNEVVIVKDVDGDNKITLDRLEDEKITVDNLITNYHEAENLRGGEGLDGVVFLDELADKSTIEVRKLLDVAQYVLYNPPGDSQWLAVIVKNHDSVLECLLFMGEMSGDKFELSHENPWRRTLVMGSVGMKPVTLPFQIVNDDNSRIVNTLSDEINGGRRRKVKLQLKRMPECLIRVPLLDGNMELDEGDIVELLDVKRDSSIRGRYSPSSSPLFLSATIVNCDGCIYEVKVVDGEEDTTYHVDLSEGLLYPVGTADRLGVKLRGERANEAWRYSDEVGGPKKCERDEWRGFAQLLIYDEESPSIRPIVIRNLHFGILAEFSFLDSMENGSLLFPISNPLVLPCQFSKTSEVPVVFDNKRVNRRLLEEVFNEERRDRVAVMTRDRMDEMEMDMSMNGNVHEEEEDAPIAQDEKSNSVPLEILDSMSHSQILSSADSFDENLLFELEDISGAEGESLIGTISSSDDETEKMNPSGEKREEREDYNGLNEQTEHLYLHNDGPEKNNQSLGDQTEVNPIEKKEQESHLPSCDGEKKEKEIEMKKGDEPREAKEGREKSEEEEQRGNKKGEVVRRRGEVESSGRDTNVNMEVDIVEIVRPKPDVKKGSESYETTLTPSPQSPSLRNIKRSLSIGSSIESSRSKKKKMGDISPSSTPSPSLSPYSNTTQLIGRINITAADGLDETGVEVATEETVIDAVVEKMIETVGEGTDDIPSTTIQIDKSHPIPMIQSEEKEGEKFSLAKTALTAVDMMEKTEKMDEDEEKEEEGEEDVEKEGKDKEGEENVEKEGEDKEGEEIGTVRIISKSPLKLMEENKNDEMEDYGGEKMEMEKEKNERGGEMLEIESEEMEAETEEKREKIHTEAHFSQEEEMMDERREENEIEMLDEGIPSSSSNYMVQSESRDEMRNSEEKEKDMDKKTCDTSNGDVPCKRSRMESSMVNGMEKEERGENEEKDNGVDPSGRGVPLDPSFNAFELPPHQARIVAKREGGKVRGGHPRAPFLRDIEPVNGEDERLIGGEEELQRIQMEQVLKKNKLLRVSDKIIDKDIVTVDIMRQFRNPLEWNSIEVQLFFDQIDIEPPLMDYLKEQDLDGMKVFKLTPKEIMNEFPHLGEHDFNEKMFFFGFIDKLWKIAKDPEITFASAIQYPY